MTVDTLATHACDKSRFETIEGYIDFARAFLEYVPQRLQAVIVARNEPHYNFWQYPEEGGFSITRPINSKIMYSMSEERSFSADFLNILTSLKDPGTDSAANSECLNRSVYTLQQCIGAALDGLPASKSNNARKINGERFERLIRLLLVRVGVDCRSGIVKIPILLDGEEAFTMNYQHDMIVKHGELDPLDGVYYCDIRPTMRTAPILRDHIKTFDRFLFDDLWQLMKRDAVAAVVEPGKEDGDE